MTARFLKFIPFILSHEIVYNKDHTVMVEHDPSDPGGTTKYGIDQRSHPDVDITGLTEEQATQIYFDEWTAEKCERMSPKLGEVFFNCAVNCGNGRADKLRASFKDANTFLVAQESFYRRLAAARPKSQKYLKGWLNRTQDLRNFLKL